MPSDDRVAIALRSLARPLAAYRSPAVAGLERARALLSIAGADRARLELGAFGGGRIDAARFAALAGGAGLDALARSRVEQAVEVLRRLAAAGDDAFVVSVGRGESLRLAIAAALARLGCAFGALRAVDAIRGGRYEPEQHGRMLVSFPFPRWSAAERRAAPPLVVTVDGSDLRPAALADHLDGAARIVLLVRGACAPAPLVRLITPGVYVAQAADAWPLDRLAAWDGPGIVALVDAEPDSVAHFAHDPERGGALWQRLDVRHRPAGDPRRAIAGVSRQQQRDELAQLYALAERPSFPANAVESLAPAGGGDPAERLASWLLAQSGVAAEGR